MAESKTVYVLGAGFSKDAQFPLQTEYLRAILDVGIMDLPAGLSHTFSELQAAIAKFLKVGFQVDIHQHAYFPDLEHVFTLLDQMVETGGFFAGYDARALEKIRDQWQRALIYLLYHRGESLTKSAREYYQKIGNYFVEIRRAAGQKGDPIAIISLNWDTLFEDSLYRAIEQANLVERVDVDFCCYTTPLAGSPHRVSMVQRAVGLFNLKVLKLHGSANWLRCPNCQRVFTGIGKKESVSLIYATRTECPNCHDTSRTNSPYLEPYMVSPTYLKAFKNPHIQSIWHNAYIELSEATEIVFIGYSMPEADYHFRTLLRRAVREHVDIRVVLTKGSDPSRLKKSQKKFEPSLASARYTRFFGGRPTFIYEGLKGFFDPLIGS